MKLTSADFEDGGEIPEKFTCAGEGVSPNLSWSEAPAEARSLALSLVDPDAPSGNFVHWLVINIPVSASGIPSAEKIADELPNTSGRSEYFPPCPPSGKHRYIFTIYALNIENINPQSVDDFFQTIKPYVIDQSEITGTCTKI